MTYEVRKKFVERRVEQDRRELERQIAQDLDRRARENGRRWTDRKPIQLINNKSIGK